MPVTLAVLGGRDGDAVAERTVTLDGARIVLGRGAAADLVLPDPSVSLRHASVRTSGAGYALFDEGSSNGTFVGDARLTPQVPRPLRSGDRVRLGRTWIEVRLDATPATRDAALATRDLALALVRELLEAEGHDPRPRLEVRAGPDLGASLVLAEEGRAYVLGRGEGADLLLRDPDCSRAHAEVELRQGRAWLADLGSKNGCYVGGARVPQGGEVPLPAGALLELGQSVLELHEPPRSALERVCSEASDAPLLEADTDAAPPVEPAREPEPSAPIALEEPVRSPGGAPPPPAPPPARARRSTAGVDVAVIGVALTLIALSAAGLYVLLTGSGR